MVRKVVNMRGYVPHHAQAGITKGGEFFLDPATLGEKSARTPRLVIVREESERSLESSAGGGPRSRRYATARFDDVFV